MPEGVAARVESVSPEDDVSIVEIEGGVGRVVAAEFGIVALVRGYEDNIVVVEGEQESPVGR